MSTLKLAFVEKTEEGRYAVKWKERTENGEPVVLEVFDDEETANTYRDAMNDQRIECLMPAGPSLYARVKDGVLSYVTRRFLKDADVAFAEAGDALETAEINGVEILATGTWRDMNGNTVVITDEQLQEIVANFKALADKVKPYMKMGHLSDEDHAKMTGMPALGWISKLKIKAGKLLADFVKVPKQVDALITAGAYRRVSAEILPHYTDPVTGKNHGMVLKAAGILGATAPAVSTLKDIMNLYTAEPSGDMVAGLIQLSEPMSEDTAGGSDMDQKTLDALNVQVAALTANFARINTALGIKEGDDPVTAIVAMRTQSDALVAKLSSQEEETEAKAIEELILGATRKGKLLPASVPGIELMLAGWRIAAKANNGVVSLSMGGKETKGSIVECLRVFLGMQDAKIEIGRERGAARREDGVISEDMLPSGVARFAAQSTEVGGRIALDSMVLNQKVEKRIKETGETYVAAFMAVTSVELVEPDRETVAGGAGVDNA